MSQIDKPQQPPCSCGLDGFDGLASTSCEKPDAVLEVESPRKETTAPVLERRTFLQAMATTLALSTVSTGCRWEREEVLPPNRRYEGHGDGLLRTYATSMELDAVGTGLLVTSVDGRPIKIEGNPKHPDSLGGVGIYQQASLLELYDPDRSQGPVLRQGGRHSVTWETFTSWAGKELETLRALRGRGLGILVESTSSPTVARLRRELTEALPELRWAEWCVNHCDEAHRGSLLAFGRVVRPVAAYDRAEIVLCLDADPTSPVSSFGLSGSRGVAKKREPDERFESSRIYAVESSLSGISAIADHRLPLRAIDIGAFTAELDALLTARIRGVVKHPPAHPVRPARSWLQSPHVRAFLEALVFDLVDHHERSIVTVGQRQPAFVHALGHRINALLGNAGNTVGYVEVPEASHDYRPIGQQLDQFVFDMTKGRISTLFIFGGNPVLTAPTDLRFAEALAKVKQSVHLSVFEDETSEKVNWHLPMAHYLESWGDCRAFDGTVSLVQPLILPLFAGRSTCEMLAFLLTGKVGNGRALLRRSHELLSESAYRKALHDGIIEGSAIAKVTPTLLSLADLTLPDDESDTTSLELVLSATDSLHDGRYANNAWLLELPCPITKVTWENALRIAPKTAQELGIIDGESVALAANNRSIAVNVVVVHGQAERSLLLALGWGRTAAGSLGGLARTGGEAAGTNGYVLRTAREQFLVKNVSLQKTGKTQLVAKAQQTYAGDWYGSDADVARIGRTIREVTLERYKANPGSVRQIGSPPPAAPLWNAPVSYDGHRWAMSVDLNKCTGCNACVVACQAENNIPTVGKLNVVKGREMHWIRVDRYYTGTRDAVEIAFQPLGCQQCENAPCEQACPVGATVHSSEGLNDMTYNRCIGTRYCAASCPYKVRQFNYFDYHFDEKGRGAQLRKLAYNPDVSVRGRGVTEKCTFCVQRISRGKLKAKKEKRILTEGDIVTACQQACPTGAIVFGDLNARNSEVTRLLGRARSYSLLGELNCRPRVQYLARIRNRNPKLTG